MFNCKMLKFIRSILKFKHDETVKDCVFIFSIIAPSILLTCKLFTLAQPSNNIQLLLEFNVRTSAI